jgi:hypothetical protein
MSMTLEDLIKLIAMLGVPTIGSVAWLITMLMSIKTDIKKIEVQLEMRNNIYDDRITRLEKHVHDIRNSLQTLTLGFARKGLDDDSK